MGNMKDPKKNINRMVSRLLNIRNHLNPKNKDNKDIIKKEFVKKTKINEDQNYIFESSQNLPILDKCQVLVIGGGPSGLSAAIGAARTGVDVILMERFGCFGGVITTVGMETIGWYRYEGTIDSEGIGVEMERIAADMGGTVKFPYNDSQCLDADYFKLVADHLVKKNKIRPYLHIYAVDV